MATRPFPPFGKRLTARREASKRQKRKPADVRRAFCYGCKNTNETDLGLFSQGANLHASPHSISGGLTRSSFRIQGGFLIFSVHSRSAGSAFHVLRLTSMFVADSRQKSQTFVLKNDEIPASNGTVVRVVQIDETMRAAQCPLIERYRTINVGPTTRFFARRLQC